MKTHNLIQGSAEWHAHRASHFNASDAPAMMGCSLYETRTQLLHRLKTGITPEVDAATQRRFDDGHRFEALARPLAEEIIGDDLYPVTGTEGELSASFDGLSMDELTAFEHKSLNAALCDWFGDFDSADVENVKNSAGNTLPRQYCVQMEQQCIVSGAELVLFMASKWDGDTLVKKYYCWYTPDPKLRAEMLAGWKQFAIDLATYTPVEAAPVAIGRAPETLPALHIEVTGMVTASNLDAFKANAMAVFGQINRELKTDADFANAEKTVKWCGDVEDRLAAAKQHALSQTASIDVLFKAIDDISAEARAVRLELDKLVKARKEAIRGELVAEGVKALADHVNALNARLGKTYLPISVMSADFGGAIKGKRTIDSLRDAVSTTLANAKIAASAVADRIQVNLDYLREDVPQGHAFLFSDLASIVLKENDDFRTLIDSRILAHKTKRDQEEADTRERIRAEEQAKAEAAVREAERVKAEAAAKLVREAEAQTAIEARLATADQREQARQVEIAGAVLQVRAAQDAAPAANVVPITRAAPAPQAAPATPPTLKLGEIGTRLGFSLTGEFLRQLGFEPAARDKSALLFHEVSFSLICAALVKHIEAVQGQRAA